MSRWRSLLPVALIAMAAAAPAARAAFPGTDGRIAFSRCDDSGCNSAHVWAMDPGGANQAELIPASGDDEAYSAGGRLLAFSQCTPSTDCRIGFFGGFGLSTADPPAGGGDDWPSFSPDGQRIVWQLCPATGSCAIWVGGAKIAQLTQPLPPASDGQPAFSPDGSKVAFTRCSSPTDCQIRVVAADGSGDGALTSGPLDQAPNWSPDGSRIVFQRCCDANNNARIFTMAATGGTATPITTPDASSFDTEPAFSPDGAEVVFVRAAVSTPVGHIETVPAGGGAVVPLTSGATSDYKPDWQPGPPVFTAPPRIAGRAVNGQLLTGAPGSVVGGGTAGFAWYRCNATGGNCSRFPVEQGTSHWLATDDIGHTLKLRQVQTSAVAAVSGDSALTAPVQPSTRRCFNLFSPKKVSVTGTRGGDRIFGSPHNDHLSGGPGRDCIKGGRGSDRISGGSGADDLWGEDGNDQISGGAGNDKISGGPGRNRVSGGAGNDVIDVANGRPDVVDCGPGRDSVRADAADRLSRCERIRR